MEEKQENVYIAELKEAMYKISEEAEALQIKIIKLENFMITEKYYGMNEGRKQLLIVQLYLMSSYYQVLCVQLKDMADELTAGSEPTGDSVDEIPVERRGGDGC